VTHRAGDVEVAADALMQITPEEVEAMKFTTPISPSEKKRRAAQSNQEKTRVARGGRTGPPRNDNTISWGNSLSSNSQRRPAEYVGASRSSGMAADASAGKISAQAASMDDSDDIDVVFNYDEEQNLDDDAAYQSFRAQALKARRQRDRLREQAQTHYLHGEDKLRRDKLAQARALSEQIQQLNDSAADHIFNFKNRQGTGMDDFKMDLHGLHAREAVRYLDHRILDLSAALADVYDVKERKDLLVVVGKGIHQRGTIMLQPAIQEFLKTAQVRSKWKPEEGTFHVSIPRVYQSKST
jgi:hypothetical protein